MTEINEKQLCEFIVKAKRATYASGNSAKEIINKDKSKTLVFRERNWKYNDNYFNGEPFGGREVLFFKNKPIYAMVYYGSVDKKITNFNDVYKFLQEALMLVPIEHPFRGPAKYTKGSYSYKNKFKGGVDNFFGEEIISVKNKIIYRARYAGGFINQRS